MKTIKFESKNEGPNIAIIVGVHGNEVCGVEAYNELTEDFSVKKGSVTFILANEEAVNNNVRFVDKDLNRSFSSTLMYCKEELIAKEIEEILFNVDAMLDVHASTSKDSVPFAICEPQSFKAASYLPVDKVLSNIDAFHSGSTDEFMNKQKKVGICIECGYLGDSNTTQVAIDAIKSFCGFYGLIDYDINETSNQEKYKCIDLYRNKSNFIPAKKFADFETLQIGDLIGKDGKKEILANKDDVMLFVSERKKKNEECFITARKI